MLLLPVRQDDQGGAGQEVRAQLACGGGRGVWLRTQLRGQHSDILLKYFY